MYYIKYVLFSKVGHKKLAKKDISVKGKRFFVLHNLYWCKN